MAKLIYFHRQKTVILTKDLDSRRVNEAQSANQNKGLNNDVQNACELLIIEIFQNLFRLSLTPCFNTNSTYDTETYIFLLKSVCNR